MSLPAVHRVVSDWLRREAFREWMAREDIESFRPMLK
jgi:hypothetical protein